MKLIYPVFIFINFCATNMGYAQQADTSKIKRLKEVIIEGQKQKRYADTLTSSGTRLPINLLDIPQSIQSVNGQAIRDQQANTMNEALKNVAGVTSYSWYMDYVIRGFRTNFIGSNFTYNGIKGVFFDFSQAPTLYNVDRVEVIKGPASVLFSAGAPGGVINTVTKQPLAAARYEINATYGSFNQKRLSLDATGPLNKSKKLLYRFIAGGENSDSFRDYLKIKNIFLAPSIKYLISDKTDISFEANYMNDKTNIIYDRGIAAPQNPDGSYNFNAVPLNFSRHNPEDHTTRNNASAQLTFNHRFSDKVSITTLARYSYYNFHNFQHASYGALAGDSITDRIYEVYPVRFNSVNVNAFATFKFLTGKIRHIAVAGFDYGITHNPYSYSFYAAPSISVFHPDITHDDPPTSFPKLYFLQVIDRNVVVGGYIQDQVEFTQKLKALLSLRYDNYNYIVDFYSAIGAAADRSITQNDALLPRLGIVYEPVITLSLYASYTRSFNPNSDNYSLNVQRSGGPFKPEEGVQYEAGAKKEWFNKNLITTVSFYQITKTNVLVSDPTDPLGLRMNSHGEARSRGAELAIQGTVTQSLSVIANYAYNQTIITKDNNPANIGNWLPNAPRHIGNTWLKYNFLNSTFKGFGVGGGFNFSSKRATEAPQDFKLPGFINYDAAVSYHYQKATLSFNAYNLGNTRNFLGGYSSGVLYIQAPISYRLNLDVVF